MAERGEPRVVGQARGLLGRRLTAHGVTLDITEVEAYAGPDDPASHARTKTPRSQIMYGPPYRLYVYRSYGIHHCANIVVGEGGEPGAVLIRAGRVIDGADLARLRRGRSMPHDQLARGPGNVGSALGLTLDDNGVDLSGEGVIRLHPPPVSTAGGTVASGPRVGVARAADRPWRFWLEGDPSVSAYRRSARLKS